MTGKDKWLLSAGHHHLFHIVAPIVARPRDDGCNNVKQMMVPG